ncbi:MAG: hypothetical protein JHC31_12445 [Sulfurihydrogenibium sp.]|jgi:hypothetical protein|nr:hypothetical protein [Sulfurihydrogenibium sp.]
MKNLNLNAKKIVIEEAKEKIEKFRVRFSDENDKATYTDHFILYNGDNFVEIITDEELLNKKTKISIENEKIFDDILTTTDILIPVEKRINVEELAKHIKIETA